MNLYFSDDSIARQKRRKAQRFRCGALALAFLVMVVLMAFLAFILGIVSLCKTV